MEQETRSDIAPPQRTMHGNVTGFNLSRCCSLSILMKLIMGPNEWHNWCNPRSNWGSKSTLLTVQIACLNPRHSIRMIPTVMANVAGYCDLCGKCYDQIALETLGEYLVAKEYGGETVKERAIRSRAFIHEFEAAFFLLKMRDCRIPRDAIVP